MMIKNIVFDFDGTIVDSKYKTVEILNELADKYSFTKIKKEDYEYLRNSSIMDRIRAINVPVFAIPFMAIDFAKKYGDAAFDLQLSNGIDGLIGNLLNSGLRLSIISSNSIYNINSFLKARKIDCFDEIYSSGSIWGKDVGIRLFMNKNKLRPEDIIFVGDECRDIVACKKIKVTVIAVTWGYDSVSRLEKAKPDFIVNTPSEIIGIINSIRNSKK